jgi:hypothetical protein
MPRKIYIATAKDDAGKAKLFGYLGNRFNITDNPADAEFLVLDCDEPAPLRTWVTKKAMLVILERCYPPIILATDGKTDSSFLQKLADAYDGDVSELYSCTGAQELLKTLNRLEAALPFYNTNNTPDQREAYELAIDVMKSLQVRRNHDG